MRHDYSQDFKEQIVKKLLSSTSRGLTALSKETGIPVSTIATWKKKMQITSEVNTEEKLPMDWSISEKIKAVFEFSSLKDDKLGMWLRQKGLHSDYLELWKQEIIDMSQDQNSVHDLKQAKKKIKELEADLRKKDRALAEASALLVLKKKAHLIWGVEEN